jgi:hypothetical protein
MDLPLIALALGLSCAGLDAQAACYTVYAGTASVYRSTTPPVDLSLAYSETVPAKFGRGASMVTSIDETGCSQVVLSAAPVPEGISAATPSARRARALASSAASRPSTGAPVSLDGVFTDRSLQMRSSVGVSGPASGASVTKPEKR